jgi:hypothetical protein
MPVTRSYVQRLLFPRRKGVRPSPFRLTRRTDASPGRLRCSERARGTSPRIQKR